MKIWEIGSVSESKNVQNSRIINIIRTLDWYFSSSVGNLFFLRAYPTM